MEASVVGEEARSAQDAAFERFYRRYAKHVYRYTLALLRNPADAEDVTQTTFLNAYRAMRQGQHPRKPHNWLIKIAHNTCRSRYVMRKRRVAEVPLDDALDQLIVPEDEKPNVRAVLRALGRLPFNQRAALVMRELEGRSYAEIAETLGVSVSAVEMLIFRARKSMRLRASSLRALGAVQLPASLASFGSSGGVAVTVGAGGVAGVGLVKLVAALAAATAVVGASGGALNAGAGNSVSQQAQTAPVYAVVTDSAASARPTALRGSATAKPVRRKAAVTVRRANAPVAQTTSGAENADAVQNQVGGDGSLATRAPDTSERPSGGGGGSQQGGGAANALPAVNVPVQPPPVAPPQVSVPVAAPPIPPLPVETPQVPEPPKLP